MKKSIKRMLTAALVLTMMVTMLAIPVSAYPTDTKTFVLMNDDMSSAITAYHNDKTEATTSYVNFFAGKQWSQPWDYTTASFKVDNGDVAFYANAADRTNDQAIKGAFRAAPVIGDAKASNVTMTYDVKTGSRTTNPVIIHTTIDTGVGDYKYVHGGDDITISKYDSSTGKFYHGGWHDYNVTLSENTEYKIEYKFNYDSGMKNHMLSIVITDKAGSTSITDGEENVAAATLNEWDFYKTDIKTLTAIGYMLSCTAAAEAEAGSEVFRIQNIKIENIVKGDVLNFGDVAYDNSGVKLSEKMGDINIATVMETTTEDTGYLSGDKWAATQEKTNWTFDKAFTTDGEYLWSTIRYQQYNSANTDTLSKKFAAVENGGTLTLTGKVNFPAEGRGNKNKGCYIALGSADGASTYTLLHFVVSEGQSNKYHLSSLGYNASANYSSMPSDATELRVWNWWNYHNESTDLLYCGNDYPFTLTMVPNANDNSKYDMTFTLNANGSDLTATKTIDAVMATSLDTVKITMTQSWQQQEKNTCKFMGFKDLQISTTPANLKNALAVGENTVYLPVENVTGHAVDYAIVAAVYETGKELPKDFAVATYTGHQKGVDKLAINGVTISNTDTEYVKLYVFDKFETIVPYVMPISTNE